MQFRIPGPDGIRPGEHYSRRWAGRPSGPKQEGCRRGEVTRLEGEASPTSRN